MSAAIIGLLDISRRQYRSLSLARATSKSKSTFIHWSWYHSWSQSKSSPRSRSRSRAFYGAYGYSEEWTLRKYLRKIEREIMNP